MAVITYDVLFEELKKIPVDRLQELYTFMHALRSEAKSNPSKTNPALSFSGAFRELSEEDYEDFLAETKATREGLLDRKDCDI